MIKFDEEKEEKENVNKTNNENSKPITINIDEKKEKNSEKQKKRVAKTTTTGTGENVNKWFLKVMKEKRDKIFQNLEFVKAFNKNEYKKMSKTINVYLVGVKGSGKTSMINTVSCLLRTESDECQYNVLHTSTRNDGCTTCLRKHVIESHDDTKIDEKGCCIMGDETRLKLCFFDTPGDLPVDVMVKAILGKVKVGKDIQSNKRKIETYWKQHRTFQAEIIVFVLPVDKVLLNIEEYLSSVEKNINTWKEIKKTIVTDPYYHNKMYSDPIFYVAFTKIDKVCKIDEEKLYKSKNKLEKLFTKELNCKYFYLRNCVETKNTVKKGYYCVVENQDKVIDEYKKFLKDVFYKGVDVWANKNTDQYN